MSFLSRCLFESTDRRRHILQDALTVSKSCDYFQSMKPNVLYTIQVSRSNQRNLDCRWAAEAPAGHKISLTCDKVRLPTSFFCLNDRITVSTTGRTDLRDGKSYCGRRQFEALSVSTKMTVALKTGAITLGAKFKCSMKTVIDGCRCGQVNRGKIVGGMETYVNEYPSMAGLIDANEKRVFCGATIISSTHALSAAHCSIGREISSLGLLVGEHDTTKGSETPFTKLLKIASFTNHPTFSQETNADDIALIRIQNSMTFTYGVQPACLPFKFRKRTFVNTSVEALGWYVLLTYCWKGATEFSGPQSNVLKHVRLSIVNSESCTSKQICSFAKNKDTCQSDSGKQQN
ncbi:CLUMA_CG018706, isoform A [Clunio marinus]|uniref:CLUMA_CG018706, isoform A n=1 Tax=Clunio marinus TaxID=568069 RepID=A0A1J1J482_9DIPT|nr:CLUMA_CG018706, isoform A [Clunio marinus]